MAEYFQHLHSGAEIMNHQPILEVMAKIGFPNEKLPVPILGLREETFDLDDPYAHLCFSVALNPPKPSNESNSDSLPSSSDIDSLNTPTSQEAAEEESSESSSPKDPSTLVGIFVSPPRKIASVVPPSSSRKHTTPERYRS